MITCLKTRFAYVASLIIVSAFVLCGCGRDADLDEYKQNMEQYFVNAAALDSYINGINPETDIDGHQLLGYLDQLDSITSQMAEVEVPEQFSLVDSLADEASENMTAAVGLYHQFYEAQEPDINISDAAYQYYIRANKRIVYIRSILQGNIPEELTILEDDGNSDSSTPQGESIASPTEEVIDNQVVDDSTEYDFDTDDTVFYEGE